MCDRSLRQTQTTQHRITKPTFWLNSDCTCVFFCSFINLLLDLDWTTLDHFDRQDGERGVLLFTATMTVVRNGRVQEVPFDTQTEAFDVGDKRGVTLPTVATREAGGGQKVNRHDVK